MSDGCVSPEVVFMRCLGIGFMGLMFIATLTTRPYPGLHGKGLAVLLALCAMPVAFVVSNPRSAADNAARLWALGAIAVAGAILAAVQPDGIWEASPYYVAIVAAMRLERTTAVWALGLTLALLAGVGALGDHWGASLSTMIGALPWFLVLRQMRRMHEQNVALEASQTAEARAAAAAERGRLAREMHDVLAHTLSALALQLESTRLLAHDRGVDVDISSAIDQAHGLAASGLEEARRAISTARGDTLPGPERVGSLAEAFSEQSGLPAEVQVHGDPRELPAEARLAVYRTAQEALTNIRRHASPARVDVSLEYGEDAVALVVEDHGEEAAPLIDPEVASPSAGYGLTGMRERAELLGGTLMAEPTRDGFRVRLWLPA
jgi:signal transduction histidine kinase